MQNDLTAVFGKYRNGHLHISSLVVTSQPRRGTVPSSFDIGRSLKRLTGGVLTAGPYSYLNNTVVTWAFMLF